VKDTDAWMNGRRWGGRRGRYVGLITDRDAWADRALAGLSTNGTIYERLDWGSAVSLKEPAAGMLVDVTPPFAARLQLLRGWAARAWQPACICCLVPEFGAADALAELGDLGYSTVLPASTRDHDWQDIRRRLDLICGKQAWLVPQIARALDCYDLPLIEALEAALDILPAETTVKAWVRELGLPRRQRLESLLAKRGLPPPKEILEWLRLARVIESSAACCARPTRRQLAEEFQYPDADYLGRRAKKMTGRTLGALLGSGVGGVLEIMAERVA
jgi:hypothetical protein